MLRTVTTIREMRELPGRGTCRVAFVPTMGALHEGHLSLLRVARERIGPEGLLVASIFVNPAQFAAGEDYDRYPRPFEADRGRLAAAGADVLFAPAAAEMYPAGAARTIVRGDPAVASTLEGAHRPGHFDGMLTVVCKLFSIVRPDVAVFGEKDAQQLFLVRAMVRDLNLPVEIVGAPTVREPDGLARSSRNAYLSAAEREHALALPRALDAAERAAAHGAARARAAGLEALAGRGIEPDYLELVDPVTFQRITPGTSSPGEALALVAARVGTTRLIDNRRIRLGT